MSEEIMVKADNLVKIYKTREDEVLALQGLDLVVNKGELMAIIGNSGSGKSTFLNMLGGLDTPSAGKLFVDGMNLFGMSDKELTAYKQKTVGFVWQNNARNLLPYLTALENVMLPMFFVKGKQKKERAESLLSLVGLSERMNNKLSSLSGGEQQRVAIAIALANEPKLLLADEPTGSVDRKTSDMLLSVFQKVNKELGVTVIIVTHDVSLTRKVGRVALIRDGKISSERIAKVGTETFTDALAEKEQEEYLILDRAGRIQLPKEMLSALPLSGNQIKATCEKERIILEAPEGK